jgi:hypothetical protein
MYNSTLFLTSALDGVGGKRQASAVLPTGKTRYPLYKRLGGPQGRSGRMRKISPAPGFDSRTVQPVASCCTDYAIRCQLTTHLNIVRKIKNAWSYNSATPSSIFLRRLVPFYHLMPYRMVLSFRKVSIRDSSLKVSRKLYAKDSLRRLIFEIYVAVKLCKTLLAMLFVKMIKLIVRCTESMAHGMARL